MVVAWQSVAIGTGYCDDGLGEVVVLGQEKNTPPKCHFMDGCKNVLVTLNPAALRCALAAD